MPVSAGHVQQHVQQQHSVLAQPSLHKSLTEQSRLLFNMHLTVLPETEYTRELIYTGERFENIRHIDRALCGFFPFLQMMQNLLLEEGGLVQVESVNLQVATYSKFQPQSPDFLDITNPKAVYPSYSIME